MDECLDLGIEYAWFIRADRSTKGANWSEPRLFRVADIPSQDELWTALTIVNQYLKNAEDVESNPQSEFLWFSDLFSPTCENGMRYEDNGDGTVTDCRTGLIWLRDASCADLGSRGNWKNMVSAVATLADGACGLTDGSQAGFWRLPTVTELMEAVASAKAQGFDHPTLTNAAGDLKWSTDGDAFIGVEFSCCEYWTSSEIDLGSAWDVDIRTGNLDIDGKGESNWVWPVRSGLQVDARTVTGSPNASCRDSEMLVGGGCDCGSNSVAVTTLSSVVTNSWVCKCDGTPFNGTASAICVSNP